MKKSNEKQWLVYLLKCANNSLYCGVTNDINKRLRQHNGEITGGSKYTHANAPCKLVYQEYVKDRSTAQQRECEIKTMKRGEKLKLLEGIGFLQ